MDNGKITFRSSQEAFREAIQAGRLSEDESASNYAGHYMYIWTQGSRDLFKHRDTPDYLP